MRLVKTSDGFEYYKVAKKHIPKGYSNDPDDLKGTIPYDDGDGDVFPPGQQLPIVMFGDDGVFLLQIDGTFYLYWAICCELDEIVEPTTIEGILHELDQGKYCQNVPVPPPKLSS